MPVSIRRVCRMQLPSEGTRALAFERAIGPQPVRPGNGCGRLFSAGRQSLPLQRETK
jgi:hypothetical protein